MLVAFRNSTVTVGWPPGQFSPLLVRMVRRTFLMLGLVFGSWQVEQVNSPYLPPTTPQPPWACHLEEAVSRLLCRRSTAPARVGGKRPSITVTASTSVPF